MRDMARQKAYQFAKALDYLESCGKLTKEKFIKVNQIAGDEFSESQLEQMWEEIEIAIVMKGDGELRQTLRNTFEKGAAVFGYTADGLGDIEREQRKWWQFWK